MLNEKGKINYHHLIEFLRREKIGIYFKDSSMKDLKIVQEVTENIIDEINHNQLSKLIESELINSFSNKDLSNFYSDATILNPAFHKKFNRYEINKYRDQKNNIHLFFNENIIRITADNIEVLKWNECNFNGEKVWLKNVSDKYFNIDTAMQYENSMWYNFCKNAVTEKGLPALMQSLGYMIHNYKDPSVGKMIVYADGSDNSDSMEANGRSGKTLISYEALKRLRKLTFIEGKRFDSTNRFAYQTVDPLSDIVMIDDVKPDFRYVDLYNAITNYFSIERKGLQPITLSYEESPKFLVTSNYGILSSGGSDIGRREVIGFSNYYNVGYSPKDEFKTTFFKEWSNDEYNWFYGFFIKSCQMYLKEGLTSFGNEVIDKKALINVVGTDFYDWVTANMKFYVGRVNAHTTSSLQEDVPHMFLDRFKKIDRVKGNFIKVAKQIGYKVVAIRTTIGSVNAHFFWFENINTDTDSSDNDNENDALPF